jgi:hypothetical protein
MDYFKSSKRCPRTRVFTSFVLCILDFEKQFEKNFKMINKLNVFRGNNTALTSSHGVLVLTNVKESHAGSYLCAIFNGARR